MTEACSRHPLVTVLVSLALAAAAMAYTLNTITFVTSSLRLFQSGGIRRLASR